MNLRSPLLVAALAAFLFTGFGCANNKLTAERDSLAAQNKDLQEKTQALEQSRQADQAKIDALQRQVTTAPPAAESQVPPMGGGPLELTGVGRGPGRATSTTTTRTPVSTKATTTRVKLPGEVLFESGKTTLNSAATKQLDTMAATIKKSHAGDKIVIEGYTDTTPVKSTATNLKSNDAIATARATAVKTYLAKKGIPEKDMSVKSMGDSDPKSKTNQALNRRVEIVVVK